jgi:hypothetical protein
MKVVELIEKLREFPGDVPVVRGDSEYSLEEFDGVSEGHGDYFDAQFKPTKGPYVRFP